MNDPQTQLQAAKDIHRLLFELAAVDRPEEFDEFFDGLVKEPERIAHMLAAMSGMFRAEMDVYPEVAARVHGTVDDMIRVGETRWN